MNIALVTDAWSPQVNGVVRTLKAVIGELTAGGHRVAALTPEGRRGLPFPLYPEITITLATPGGLGAELAALRPEAVHIATEGPLGWVARSACLSRGIPFTTSFHTRFAEYAAARVPLPGIATLGWRLLRVFHGPSANVLAPTPSVAQELERRGIGHVRVWTRGIDRTLFHPYTRDYLDLPRPILLYAGRLAPEKNLGDFLSLPVAGTKVVVGDGPDRASLQRRHPDVRFLGFRYDQDFARVLASADVLVFPSRTDTFGLVMLEAMACGTPVAAYDVASPIDVVADGVSGCLDGDLAAATRRALLLDRDQVQRATARFTWARAAGQFLSWLRPIDPALWASEERGAPLLHMR